MKGDNKESEEKKEQARREQFQGFESEEEFLEAVHRLEQYLQTLKEWDEKLKWKVPPEMLN